MESHVINRIRRHLFVGGKLCNKSIGYFPLEIRVINRIRRHLLSLAIFSMESHVINRIRRHLLLLAIFSNGKLCNKSY